MQSQNPPNKNLTSAKIYFFICALLSTLLLTVAIYLTFKSNNNLSSRPVDPASEANFTIGEMIKRPDFTFGLGSLLHSEQEPVTSKVVAKPALISEARQYASRAEDTQATAERYAESDENSFLETARAPLSTFAIDVDTASYSNVRRFLNDGRLPPRNAVRIEELINYFAYDYPQPLGTEPFSVTTEIAQCPWNRDHKLVLVGLQGRTVSLDNVPPSNLVFLVDVSGSMADPDKLPLLKQSFKTLVNQLSAKDRIAIVVYAGNSGLVLPSTAADRKGEILAALDNLEADGSTNGGEGIQLAYRIAQENFIRDGNNRVILATGEVRRRQRLPARPNIAVRGARDGLGVVAASAVLQRVL